jgi:hypothetical protein
LPPVFPSPSDIRPLARQGSAVDAHDAAGITVSSEYGFKKGRKRR